MTASIIVILVYTPCACFYCSRYMHLYVSSLMISEREVGYRWFSTHSGARYPVVPSTRVETWPLILSEAILANPKSDTLARKFWSKRTLVHLKSRCITDGMFCSWRNSRALAQSRAILNRVPQSNGWWWFLEWRWCCRVPLGMHSNIRSLWCWSAQ